MKFDGNSRFHGPIKVLSFSTMLNIKLKWFEEIFYLFSPKKKANCFTHLIFLMYDIINSWHSHTISVEPYRSNSNKNWYSELKTRRGMFPLYSQRSTVVCYSDIFFFFEKMLFQYIVTWNLRFFCFVFLITRSIYIGSLELGMNMDERW